MGKAETSETGIGFEDKLWAAGARSFPGMPQATFDALPTRLIESELGPVPEGWVVGKIKDCCTHIQNGGTPRRNEPRFWEKGEIPWLTSGEVPQPIITTPDHFITEAGLEESSAKWVSPLFEHCISNLYQSRTLAALRDYLLPKLLSGEVRVAADSVCSILEPTAAARERRPGHE